jgi:hypothetical protein
LLQSGDLQPWRTSVIPFFVAGFVTAAIVCLVTRMPTLNPPFDQPMSSSLRLHRRLCLVTHCQRFMSARLFDFILSSLRTYLGTRTSLQRHKNAELCRLYSPIPSQSPLQPCSTSGRSSPSRRLILKPAISCFGEYETLGASCDTFPPCKIRSVGRLKRIWT